MISGSPDEREIEVEEILSEKLPPIVLCAAQYREDVRQTFDYVFRKGYEVFVQWLNPGYSDSGTYQDQLNIADYLLKKGATLQIRNGAIDPIA